MGRLEATRNPVNLRADRNRSSSRCNAGGECSSGAGRVALPPQPSPASGRGRIVESALLPTQNTAHVGQMVRDSLVAVDAGLFAGEQESLMCDRGAGRLLGDVHRLRAVAVATNQQNIGLE